MKPNPYPEATSTSETGQSAGISPIVTRAHDHARAEISRSDTKAGALLTTVSLALAVGIAVAQAHVPTVARIGLAVAALPVLAAIIVLLRTVRPTLTTDATIGSWLHAAYHGPAELLKAREFADVAVAEDVCVLGGLAVAKHRRIRIAVDLLITSVAFLPVALVLAVLGGM